MSFSNITLVIPTYNRPSFVLRAINYWSRFPVALHVWDGSAEPLLPSQLSGLGLNIKYFHRPVGFYARLREAVAEVTTPYCILAGDDEFYLPSALQSAISELESDSSLVSCGGQAVGFWQEGTQWYCQRQYPEFSGRWIKGDTPALRMNEHMSHYVPSTIYSVTRTPVWQRVMSMMLEKEFPVYALGELQFEVAMAYMGGTRNLDTLFWLRSQENPGTRGTDISLDPDKSIENWWAAEQHSAEVSEFLNIMARALAESPELVPMVEQDVRKAFEAYLDWLKRRLEAYYSQVSIRTSLPFLRRIFNGVRRRIAARFKSKAATQAEVARLLHLKDAATLFDFNVSSAEAADLQQIVECLETFKNSSVGSDRV